MSARTIHAAAPHSLLSLHWLLLTGVLLVGLALTAAGCAASDSNNSAAAAAMNHDAMGADAGNDAAEATMDGMDHDAMDHGEEGDAAAFESDAARFAPAVFENGGDYGPSFSPDGRTVFFTRAAPMANNESIFMSRLDDGEWSEPELAPFSGEFHDKEPYVSPDGGQVYFASRRPVRGLGAKNDFDIWYVERRGDGWSAAQRVDAVSSSYNDDYPAVAADGTLVFARNDDNNNLNLWIANATGGNLGEPREFDRTINTAYAEADPWISPDGRLIIFSSPQSRPDAQGQGDLYVITRRGDEWTTPASLGLQVNSVGHEYGPALSPSGETLYFSRGLGGQMWQVPTALLDNLRVSGR